MNPPLQDGFVRDEYDAENLAVWGLPFSDGLPHWQESAEKVAGECGSKLSVLREK
jgi:hypothetical protein